MRDPRWLLLPALGVLLTLFALTRVDELRTELGIEAILPREQPAAEAYRTFLERFGGLEDVYVITELSDGDGDRLAEATERLESLLAGSPLIRRVRSGAGESDERFLLRTLLPRAPLLLSEEDLPELRRRLEPSALSERAAWIRSRLQSPAGTAEAPLLRADPLGLAPLVMPSIDGGPAIDPASELFLSTDGSASLIVLTPEFATLDRDAGERLVALLDSSYATVRREHGDGIRFLAIGGPLYAVHDTRQIRGNVTAMATGSMLVIVALLIFFFRSLVTPLILAAAVAVGVLWTAAAVELGGGRLTVIGLSFAAILIGLGVDYGIHAATRYRDELEAAEQPGAAMRRALAHAAPAIATSAATTAAAALVLTRSDLAAVRELGLLVAVGIVAVMLATLLVAAGALVFVGRPRPAGRLAELLNAGVESCVAFGERRRALVLGGAALISVAAAVAATRVEVDPDLRSMRPANSEVDEAERMLTQRFGMALDGFHVIVEAPSLGELLDESARVSERLRAQLPPGATLFAPSDVTVDGPLLDRRLERLAPIVTAEHVARLRAELRAYGLRPEAFEDALAVLDAIARGERPPPAEPAPWLDRVLRGDATGYHAAIRVNHPRDTAVDEPTARIASIARVGAELRDLVASELRRLGVGAALALLLVLAVAFRGSPRRVLLALTPVLLGTLWLLGLCGLFSIRLNLFSVAAAPLLLGLGIDDGLYAVHGERIHGGLAAAMRKVGAAMAMTTLTTAIGFGGLAFSNLPALAAGGPLIALGTVLCLIVSLTVLPALTPRASPGDGKLHAPERGTLARLLGPFHVTGVFWFRLHQFGVRILPERALRATAYAFTLFFSVALRRIGDAVASNLEAVLGPCDRRERRRRIFRTMHSFAWCLTERYENLSTECAFETTVDNPEVWKRVNAERRGLIVLTGHVGNWEIGSAMPAAREGRDVHLVREEELDPRAQEFIRELLREGMGENYHTHFASRDPSLGVRLLEVLDRGDIVALQGDRPREGGKSLEVELFGRPFPLPVGPLALARLSGATLLPVFMLRSGRRAYRLRFGEPIHVESGDDRAGEIRAAAERFAATLEEVIRDHPHQWFCFRSLWG